MAKLVSAQFSNVSHCYNLRVSGDRWHRSGANGQLGRLYDVSGSVYNRGTVTGTFEYDVPDWSVRSFRLVPRLPDESFFIQGMTYSQLAAFLTQPTSVISLPKGAVCASCTFVLSDGTRPRYTLKFLASLLTAGAWGVLYDESLLDMRELT